MAGSGRTLARREEPGFDWARMELPEYVEALLEGRPSDQFTVVAHRDDVPVVRGVMARHGLYNEVLEGNRPQGQPMVVGKRSVDRPAPERLEAEDLARAWRRHHPSDEVTHESMVEAFQQLMNNGLLEPAPRHVR
jgi:hypothetical protein